ncbi:MAG TPA: uL22 family ribosomal protein, partial [Candidatus Paceibacterota bacterium]|nr:uL22 family ribosomal protein [Candidatus Paceibacterota bacterium]
MKAFLKNYRQAPRKVRLVAGLIRGKNVSEAIAELDFLAKRAS